ncbi:trypco2 family protein [Streptomyces sp. NRRL S-920]|uniref:trypco2 family protein n=1 Tax=Streptomyces sp. NRRL S-920 TaxID=1463921 RepID=UPI0004C63CA7|nr:trypco2 family protein [Streptomyces sp. NRRL S-920]
MIELSEVIAELRRELDEAMTAGAGHRLRFELGPVEVEASVAVERSGGADAKIRFWVLDAGADARIARGETHRISLTLHPKITGQSGPPEIAGREAERER